MKKYSKEELCLIWLNSFLDLEYKHKKELYEKIIQSEKIKSAIESQREYIISNRGESVYSTMLNCASDEYLSFILNELTENLVQAITIESIEYPQQLKNIEFPPLVLYAKGNIDLLKSQNIISMVGSRKSLPFSIDVAKNYATELYKSGFTIVTGIAEGVERAILEVSVLKNGNAISVTAGGLNRVYPKENAKLFDDISLKGLILSEYPLGFVPKRYHFPIRNRIIAGLSKGTIVISASKQSGTMYTAEYAEEFGRDLFAIPYSVGIGSGEGCNDLIKRGATLTDSPLDILEFYGVKRFKEETDFSEDEKQMLNFLSEGQKHIEEIAQHINKSVREITPDLIVLELKGIVSSDANNVYRITKKITEI